MKIVAVLGSERHTTSRGWSNLSIDGERVNWRDAISTNWLTDYGDKHAKWCECVFEVEAGAKVHWQAGVNSGPRGIYRKRQNLVFVANPALDIYTSELLGYPAADAIIRGRLQLITDLEQQAADEHKQLMEEL